MIAVDFDAAVAEQIRTSARGLEEVLKSDVMAYIGPIHPAIFQQFRNFIEQLKRSSERSENTLSIVLRTPGGSVEPRTGSLPSSVSIIGL